MTRAERLVGDAPGFRLDQFLALRRPDVSRSHWKALIAAGAVTVEGKTRSADYKLRGGEIIRVSHPRSAWADEDVLAERILHEDAQLLVLDKPAGLLMHPLGGTWLKRPDAALIEPEPNLAGLLQVMRPALAQVWRCGIVHRLDRQTSGVLLVAKTAEAQRRLLADFKERRISKLYRAIVRGVPAQRSTRVEAPIGRKPGHRKIIVTPFGKAAETSFKVVESCARAAIVEARPLTGRTHQIRAHLALMEHPVVGDVEFDKPGSGLWPPRMLLHAHEISLRHPGSGKPVSFRAPAPKDFRDYWASCLG